MRKAFVWNLRNSALADYGFIMRNRITFTVSDIHGARHFSVHKVAKTIGLCAIALVSVTFMATLGMIQFLNNEMVKLEDSNVNFSQTISGLNDKNNALTAVISDKEGELATITEKLENIELSIGLKPQQDVNIYKRIADITDKTEELALVTDKLENIEMLIGLKPQQDMNIRKRVEHANLTLSQKLMLLQNIPNGGPLENMRTTDRFGMRTHPVTGKRAHHEGIDLRAKTKLPVYATADGVVEYAAHQRKSGYGKLMIIRHNYGFSTAFGHLSKFVVKYGDFVKKGDLIAYTGNSGRSNAPHLHYEVRYIHRNLNPSNFIKWNLENYDTIFDKEKKIQWPSLIQAAARQVYPLPPPSLHTALK
jgi:murein DD-endopeptidase MepM/ murein hydrolase activator NlpD